MWHNLSKTPDDLPPNAERVLIAYRYHGKQEYCCGCRVGADWYYGGICTYKPPLAWCEIPRFEE